MTTKSLLPAGGYDELAPYYDALTRGSNYEAWTAQVLALLGSLDWHGTTMLDVACGTGNSFLPFLKRGFAVIGSDGSAAMLAHAARKAPEVDLVEADMRELPRLGAFDLVTCFDDSLNHLLDEEELGSALRSMGRNLGTGGLLVFDLNTLLAYRTTFATTNVTERDGLIFLWRGDGSPDAPPGCRATARIDVFVPEADRLFARISTAHQQRHYPPERVTELLTRAGLECVGVYGVLDDGSPVDVVDEAQQLKVLYVARLAKGGDSG